MQQKSWTGWNEKECRERALHLDTTEIFDQHCFLIKKNNICTYPRRDMTSLFCASTGRHRCQKSVLEPGTEHFSAWLALFRTTFPHIMLTAIKTKIKPFGCTVYSHSLNANNICVCWILLDVRWLQMPGFKSQENNPWKLNWQKVWHYYYFPEHNIGIPIGMAH